MNSDAHEIAIAQLVQRYVHKAERARRHGRELSFILPHTAVNNFPDLFAAVEREVNTKRGLGITSYGVAMTTLEEVSIPFFGTLNIKSNISELRYDMFL